MGAWREAIRHAFEVARAYLISYRHRHSRNYSNSRFRAKRCVSDEISKATDLDMPYSWNQCNSPELSCHYTRRPARIHVQVLAKTGISPLTSGRIRKQGVKNSMTWLKYLSLMKKLGRHNSSSCRFVVRLVQILWYPQIRIQCHPGL